MSLFWENRDFAIDVGATRVRVLERDRGVVLDVAVEDLVDESEFPDRGARLAAVCKAALMRAGARTRWVNRIRRLMASVPGGANEGEKRVLEEALCRAGAKRVFLIESPMAAAIGAGESVSNPQASTVVDIGATRIQVAVIAFAGIVVLRETARNERTEVCVEQVADLVRAAISGCLAKERYNLADDIARRGITLTGGGAQTEGLAAALQAALNLPVRVAEDPALATILGTGPVLKELDFIAKK